MLGSLPLQRRSPHSLDRTGPAEPNPYRSRQGSPAGSPAVPVGREEGRPKATSRVSAPSGTRHASVSFGPSPPPTVAGRPFGTAQPATPRYAQHSRCRPGGGSGSERATFARRHLHCLLTAPAALVAVAEGGSSAIHTAGIYIRPGIDFTSCVRGALCAPCSSSSEGSSAGFAVGSADSTWR